MNTVSRITPTARKKSAIAPSSTLCLSRSVSSSSSVVASSRRVCKSAAKSPKTFFSASKKPGSPVAPGPVISPGMKSVAADQKAQNQTDSGGDADGAPRIFLNIGRRSLGGVLGGIEQDLFGVGESFFAFFEAFLNPFAQHRHLFAGLIGGRSQQLFGVADERP